MSETIITILDKAQGKRKRKGVVLPSRRDDFLARRISPKLINFYDIGFVNTGTSEAPVWEDLPILKVPGVSFNTSTAVFTVDPFTTSDYEAYINSLFAIAPVSQWKNTFKKLTWYGEPYNTIPFDVVSHRADYPNGLYLLRPPYATGATNKSVIETGLDKTDPLFSTYLEATLSAYNMAWTQSGLYYRGLDELTIDYLTSADNWTPFSTGQKDTFKITNVFDPDAADIGTLVPKGRIDCFLIPPIVIWIGLSRAVFSTVTTDVLGIHYQASARKAYPPFTDLSWADTGGVGPGQNFNGNNGGLKTDYFDYYRQRSTRAFQVTQDGSAYAISDIDSADWGGGGLPPYALGTETISRRVTFRINRHDFSDVVFIPRLECSTGSFDLMRQVTSTVLVAVLKQGGTFYYVWDLTGDEVSNATIPGLSVRYATAS